MPGGNLPTAEEAARLEAEMPWSDERVRMAMASEPMPLIISAPADVIARFRAQPGADDLDKLCGLLAAAA
jgi:hypothetical protein